MTAFGLLGEYRGPLAVTGQTAMHNMAMVREPKLSLALCMTVAECVDRGWKWGIEVNPRRIEMKAPPELWAKPEYSDDIARLRSQGFRVWDSRGILSLLLVA